MNIAEDLSAAFAETKSSQSDSHENGVKDMLAITIRLDTKAELNFDGYRYYPFDTLQAKLQIELSHFEFASKVFRFDVYR